jgi:hypothetical protein
MAIGCSLSGISFLTTEHPIRSPSPNSASRGRRERSRSMTTVRSSEAAVSAYA